MKRREEHPTMQRVRQVFSQNDTLNAYQVAERVFVNVKNARFYCRILHANGEVHISDWKRGESGPPVPCYTNGNGIDAPRPSALTKKQLNLRSKYRMRRNRKDKEFVAKERAREIAGRVMRKVTAAPSMVSLLATLMTAKRPAQQEAIA